MRGGDGKNGKSEPNSEFEQVRAELLRRESDLQLVEQEVAVLEKKLADGAGQDLVKRGDATLVSAQAAYQARLRSELKKKAKKLVQLREDRDRAKQRMSNLSASES